MKKYILLFFAFFHGISFCQDLDENRIALLNAIQREAETIIWHERTLTPEQLQYLLNYACASYAIVIAELKLLQEAQFIFPMTWHMRYHNEEPVINAEHLSMVERSLIRFSKTYNARTTLRNAHATLSHELEKAENAIALEIVEHMANHCHHLITYFANQENTSIEKTIGNAETILDQTGSMIRMASGTYKSLHEGNYPFRNTSSGSKPCDALETALNLVTTIAKQTYKTMQATDLITTKAQDIQEFGALAFYTYYKVIYDGMKERGFDDQYFGMLFENNIMISTDPKTKTLKEPIFDTNIPFFS